MHNPLRSVMQDILILSPALATRDLTPLTLR